MVDITKRKSTLKKVSEKKGTLTIAKFYVNFFMRKDNFMSITNSDVYIVMRISSQGSGRKHKSL